MESLKVFFIAALLWPQLGQTTWNCVMAAPVAGRAEHVMFYGRDSWTGRSAWNCVSEKNERLPNGRRYNERRYFDNVETTFNSAAVAAGADSSSQLIMNIAITTETLPETLKIYAEVTNDNSAGLVHWVFASQLTSGRVRIDALDNGEHLRSLQKGFIFIRKVEP